jgi:dihydroorotase-like cyclic amidohydrolase
MASFAACAIGPVFGGLLVQKLGVRPAMLWLFLTTPALLALAVLTPSVPSPRRSLDSSEEADPAPRRSQPDTHVHFTFPDRDLEWSTETRQAAIGGVTMPLIYFRDPAPYGDSLAQFIATGQRSAHTDFVVHLGILNNGHLDQFDEVLDRFAIRSIKMYTTCKDGSLRRFGILDQDDGFILDVMRRVAARGDTVVNVHCANDDIVRRGQAHWAQHVQGQAEQWAAMRPPSTELEAIRRICLLARETGTRPHLPRVSSRRAIDIAIAERALRTEVSIETCPQHLKLKLAAASGALSNTLDVAAGLPGSGTLVPLMMDSAHRSLITTSDPVRANLRPATMPGLEHRGQIQPGYHAAMTILWPDRERRAGPGVGSPGGAAERIMPDEQRA